MGTYTLLSIIVSETFQYIFVVYGWSRNVHQILRFVFLRDNFCVGIFSKV